MVDVVVCHASEDRERIAELAESLRAAGYSVWWDQELRGGAVFSDVIQRQLDDAKCVVVGWSEHSVDSNWLKDEAAFAAARDKLVPVFLDDVTAPLGFGQYHGVDLTQWSANRDDALLDRLTRSIDALIGRPVQSDVSPDRSAAPRGAGPLRFAIIGVAVAVVVAVLLWRYGDLRSSDGDTRSIAVLPFENLSGDPDQTFFSDGMSEEIIHHLAQVEGLQVSARTSAFLFRDADLDLREVGRALGVDTVLEGSVRRSGDQIRITAQLIDAKTGFHLWSKTFNRGTGDVLVVQSEVAGEVLELLTGQTASVRVQPSPAPAVYEGYLRARALLYEETQSSLLEAGRLLDELLVQAPEDARIHAARARAWILLSAEQYGDVPVSVALASAAPHIDAALRLAPLAADSHTVLGLSLLFERRFDAAAAALEKATELAPGDALPWHWLYFAQKEAGGWGIGRDALARAAMLDPLYPPVLLHYLAAFSGARPEEAQERLARFGRRWPDHPVRTASLANAHLQRGELAAAHRYQLAYCEQMGYQRSLCGAFQVDMYFMLNLADGLNEVGSLEIEPPLLDAFMCPVDSMRPISAFADYRSNRFDAAWSDWRREFGAGGSDRGMDPATGAVYAASEARWEEVRELLEPLAGSAAAVRRNLVSLHPYHMRFYLADLALARKMTGDRIGAEALLAQLRALAEEFATLRNARLISETTVDLLDMSIAVLEDDREGAFAAYARAYAAGYRFRSPDNEPLLLQWRETDGFRELQARYDADIARERELVLAQLAGREFVTGMARKL